MSVFASEIKSLTLKTPHYLPSAPGAESHFVYSEEPVCCLAAVNAAECWVSGQLISV